MLWTGATRLLSRSPEGIRLETFPRPFWTSRGSDSASAGPIRIVIKRECRQTMIGHIIAAIALCFLIASGFSAEAQRYPNRADDDLPRNTIGAEYRVMERTPVYRSRASGERAFFYLPKNSRVEVLGKFEGWGIFSV